MNKRGNSHYNKWRDEEDYCLQKLVEQHGTENWTIISNYMKLKYNIQKRTGKQCRERWLSLKYKSQSLSSWSAQDDKNLFQLYKIHGTKWSVIAKHFHSRGDAYLKNRFYSLVRKSTRQMCKYANVKTSALDIYSIKPATLSHIFSHGLNAQEEQHFSSFQDGRYEYYFSEENYKQLTETMNLFIFKNFKQDLLEIEKYKVIEVLQKIMKIQESLLGQSNEKETKEQQDSKKINCDSKLKKKRQLKAKAKKAKFLQQVFRSKQQASADKIITEGQTIQEELDSYSQLKPQQHYDKFSLTSFYSQQIGFFQQKNHEPKQEMMIQLPYKLSMDSVIFPCWEDSEYMHRVQNEESDSIDFMHEDPQSYYLWRHPISQL